MLRRIQIERHHSLRKRLLRHRWSRMTHDLNLTQRHRTRLHKRPLIRIHRCFRLWRVNRFIQFLRVNVRTILSSESLCLWTVIHLLRILVLPFDKLLDSTVLLWNVKTLFILNFRNWFYFVDRLIHFGFEHSGVSWGLACSVKSSGFFMDYSPSNADSLANDFIFFRSDCFSWNKITCFGHWFESIHIFSSQAWCFVDATQLSDLIFLLGV